MSATIGKYLRFKRRIQAGPNARFAEYEENLLYRLDTNADGPFMIVPAGLRQRIFRLLKARDIPYVYEDIRPVDIEEPQYDLVESLREGQPELLAVICSHDHGQIEAPTGWGKSFIIRQICRLFPNTQIIICTPSIDLLNTVYRDLMSMLPANQVGKVGGGKRESDRRITVTTNKSLQRCDLLGCRLFLYDEVHTAAQKKTAEMLSWVTDAKIFGFSASPEARTDNADMLVESMFGPVIHRISYQEAVKQKAVVPIDVLMIPLSHGPEITSDRTDVLNRRGIWRNAQRNKAVATAVKENSTKDEQVLITVNKIEHALYLQKLLPDFEVVYGAMNKDKRKQWEGSGLIKAGDHPISPQKREATRIAFEDGSLKRVISTCWGTGVNFKHLGILIRADGGSTEIDSVQIPGRISRVDGKKERGLLIDFNDMFHPTLERRSAARVRIYKKRGWTINMKRTYHDRNK